MKKIKTKILLGFGVATTLVTMGSVVLSCGSSNPIPKGPNLLISKITQKMVADYVKTQDGFIPSPTADVPAVAPSTTLTNATLNGISGLTITISKWVADSILGSVTFDVFIWKEGLTSNNIKGITYDGWNITDQKGLNGVTAAMVADYVKKQDGFIPSPTADVPTRVYSSTLDDATLNGLSGLTITISNWNPNDITGSVTFDASISKTWLISKNIKGITYDGWITADQKKLNGVTAAMVADYVKTQTDFIPSATADVPTAAPSTTLTNATLNGVGGLTITISNWNPNDITGSVTFDASISKTWLISKNIAGVTYDGWKTDQNRLNAVTTDMVADYVKTQAGFAPSAIDDVPTTTPSGALVNATLNNVSDLTIAISNWTFSYFDGSVKFDVSISKSDIKDAKNILGVTYKGFKAYGTVINNDNATATENKLWSYYLGPLGTDELTIFEGVTGIDTVSTTNWKSYDLSMVSKINFPDSLKTIGDGAFAILGTDKEHINITSITFPKNIISIGKNAFVNLSKVALRLTFLGDIPGTGTPARPNLNIGSDAFAGLTISQINDQSWKDWAQNHCPEAFQQM